MILEGKIATTFFIAYILLAWTIFHREFIVNVWNISLLLLSLSVAWVIPRRSIAIRSAFLGSVFGISILLSFSDSRWKYFGWYLAFLSIFHFSEYIMVAIYRPNKISLDSFLLNQSPEYQIAAVASWIEFTLEMWLFPQMKNLFYISCVGFVLMVVGETLRKLAMITAKSNFTHHVQSRKEREHVLVTHGIYSVCRHPGYVGWFWWSLGTQVALVNPICLVGYMYASWKFFNERIYMEEITLIYFFGEEYLEYQKRVGTGLPFIKGYEFTPEMLSSDDKR